MPSFFFQFFVLKYTFEVLFPLYANYFLFCFTVYCVACLCNSMSFHGIVRLYFFVLSLKIDFNHSISLLLFYYWQI